MKQNSQPRIWTTRTYDKFSGIYDLLMKFFYPIGEKGRESIVARIKNTGSILDVACGTGTLLAMARERGLRCYGIDLSRGMLNQARVKVPDAEFSIASYYALPYPDAYFDYVVETNSLSGEFIDARKVIAEMIRVCKRGGEIYLAEWPEALEETRIERLIIKLASLTEDTPKDYTKIFSELGYEPSVEVLNKRYHVFGVKKS
jgi:ubiquinone/menaquinone biosynthesis C-methylase UbiE